jgi:UDP-N-acetyl-D-glucosamine dehydrogenase
VIEILESRGAQVSYNDPYVASLRARKLRHYETFELDSVELTEEVMTGADCVLIATDHGAYDYDWIVRHARLVVDTRNATRDVAHHRQKIVKA